MSDITDRFKQAFKNDPNFKFNSEEYEDLNHQQTLERAQQSKNELVIKALNSQVDPKAFIPKPPAAISMGEAQGYNQELQPLIIGTYGNFSAILGPPKSRKSFLKTLLTACYIGGNAQMYGGNIIGHETKVNGRQKYVIEIDTEQGDYHVKFSSKRVLDMVGAPYPQYKVFALREYTPTERLKMVDYILTECYYRYGNGIGLVLIDGIADLVNDANDLREANQVVSKLLNWSKVLNCHIINVIHQTKGAGYATGHLGSAVTKKCETVLKCTADRDNTLVEFVDTRNRAPEDFNFIVEYGLPKVVEGPSEIDIHGGVRKYLNTTKK